MKSHEHPLFVGVRTRHPRAVCLVRDGRDVGVSYAHHLHRRGLVDEPLDVFFDRYTLGKVGRFGAWHDYVREWLDYAAKRPGSVLIVRYEDLLADPLATLTQISAHFELGLDADALAVALAANSPEQMRAKEASSTFLNSRRATDAPFVRAATAGGWRQAVPADVIARFEQVAGRQLLDLGYSLSAGGDVGADA